MLKNTYFVFILFAFNFMLYLTGADFELTIPFQIFYFFFLLIQILLNLNKRLPLGEIVAITFFIDNSFSTTLLYLVKEANNLNDTIFVGSPYYLSVTENNYIPFAFVASQALLIGYYLLFESNDDWKIFINEKIKKVNTNKLLNFFILAQIGTFLPLLSSSLGQVTYLMTNLLFCAIITLTFSSQKIKPIYAILGVSIVLIGVIKSGMFSELIYFLMIVTFLYYLKTNEVIGLGFIIRSIGLAFIAIILLGLLQNVKKEYRELAWNNSSIGNNVTFFDIVQQEAERFRPFHSVSYLPILGRLNQGYLVSETMLKVPKTEPFANGETIISAALSALVPRILYPDKEEAGGTAKMRRFTNLIKVGSTSMNIGLLGEAYVNFGKTGAIIAIFCLGIFIAYIENFFLKVGRRNILFLVCFPIVFQSLVGSGTDFLKLFNDIFKAIIFIYFIYFILGKLEESKKGSLSKVFKSQDT